MNQTPSTSATAAISALLEQDRELLTKIDPDDTSVFSATAVQLARELAKSSGLLQKIEQATMRR